jgi:putative oligomerization/nucleic acid binding protein
VFVRRKPLLRAAVVGGGAYMVGKRRGQQSEASSPDPSASSDASVSDQLAQLSSLHAQGSLSDAEFASAKARLLGS